MNVGVREDRTLDHATILLSGRFDLARSREVVHEVQSAEAHLDGCHTADVNLSLGQSNRRDRRSPVGTATRSLSRKWVPDQRRGGRCMPRPYAVAFVQWIHMKVNIPDLIVQSR